MSKAFENYKYSPLTASPLPPARPWLGKWSIAVASAMYEECFFSESILIDIKFLIYSKTDTGL